MSNSLPCKKCGSTEGLARDAGRTSGFKPICKVCDNKARAGRRARTLQNNTFQPYRGPVDIYDGPPLEPEPITKPDLARELTVGVPSAVGGAERILFVPDCHVPYHDPKAFALMLHAAALFRPHTICVLGDFFDFYCVSDHDKNPRRVAILDDELKAGGDALGLLDRIGARRKIFICGNHENRLARYLSRRAPELDGIIDIPGALSLKERGWQYVPYKHGIHLGNLYVTHDVDHAGKYALFHTMGDIGQSFVIGHTHRFGLTFSNDSLGKPTMGASFGWLGDFGAIDYMHAIKARRDWSHGFGLGYLINGLVHLVPVPIIGDSCVVEGTVVTL